MVDIFKELNSVNVNGHTEEKNGLTYLSWAWAWGELKKRFPNATYSIWKDEQGRPYVYDENLGYMVCTSVTIDEQTLEMWLPVMDNNNHAMKDKPYTIKTKYKEISVSPATMFDVNKALMRCLVKNIGVFGLGLYIYAGSDLPEKDPIDISNMSRDEIEDLVVKLCDRHGKKVSAMCAWQNVTEIAEMSDKQLEDCVRALDK